MHAWVSKDTVLTKIGLEELGKCLRIPADTFNLNASMRGPAPCQFDAMAIEISNALRRGINADNSGSSAKHENGLDESS